MNRGTTLRFTVRGSGGIECCDGQTGARVYSTHPLMRTLVARSRVDRFLGFVIELESRRVHLVGSTRHPDDAFAPACPTGCERSRPLPGAARRTRRYYHRAA